MNTLVFATANENKVKEVQLLLPEGIRLRGLRDIGCFEELPETHRTIEANSLEKAMYVHEKYGVDCFSEDTGLEVYALGGEPGVDTAHYSGSRDAEANMRLLLLNLRGAADRSAQFKTVFTLILGEKVHQFTGIVTGKIAEIRAGDQGFGYDPVFVPDGYNTTFAEMGLAEKAPISHRGKAVAEMTAFLTANFWK
jgi:XTP/dITP diphosphohydrolase